MFTMPSGKPQTLLEDTPKILWEAEKIMLRDSTQAKFVKEKNFGTPRWLGSAWARATLLGMLCWIGTGLPFVYGSEVQINTVTEEEALQLGEEFGVIVGEVDEEIQEVLGLTRAEGVVVFEVIGGKNC